MTGSKMTLLNGLTNNFPKEKTLCAFKLIPKPEHLNPDIREGRIILGHLIKNGNTYRVREGNLSYDATEFEMYQSILDQNGNFYIVK